MRLERDITYCRKNGSQKSLRNDREKRKRREMQKKGIKEAELKRKKKESFEHEKTLCDALRSNSRC